MKKDILILSIVFSIFLLNFASAYNIDAGDLKYGEDIDSSLVDAYLEKNTFSNSFLCELLKETQSSKIIGQQIPDKVPFKNEIINVYIGGEIFGYVLLNNSYVDEFNCSKNLKPTYDIFIKDYNVIGEFQESNDVITLLQEKIKSEEIEIKGYGLVKKVKLSIMKVGLKVVSWFVE